eukprot:1355624-Amorphochlora_amoeboformis.AAC.1
MSPMVSSTMVSTIGASAFCAMVLCAALGLTSNAGIDSSALFSVLVLMLVGLYIGLEYASRKRREAEVLELCQKYDVHPQNGFLPGTRTNYTVIATPALRLATTKNKPGIQCSLLNALHIRMCMLRTCRNMTICDDNSAPLMLRDLPSEALGAVFSTLGNIGG